jgi:stress response protein SCP2
MTTFNLNKNGDTPALFNLSKAIVEAGKTVPTTLRFGAGWGMPADQEKMDIDLTIAALNTEGMLVGDHLNSFAYYDQKEAISGIVLSEDCRDGETTEGGDDEFADVTIANLPEGTTELLASLSVYDDPQSRKLSAADSCYIRVMDGETSEELVRVAMTELNSDAADLISVKFSGGDIIAEAIERPLQGDINNIVAQFI